MLAKLASEYVASTCGRVCQYCRAGLQAHNWHAGTLALTRHAQGGTWPEYFSREAHGWTRKRLGRDGGVGVSMSESAGNEAAEVARLVPRACPCACE